MRLIDKDALLESLKDLEASGGSKMYRKALDDALHYFFPKIIEDQQIFDFPPNGPLTLKELLEMDREPVYCITDYEITVNGEKGHRLHTEEWGIVTGTDLGDQGFVAGTACTHYLEHYGKTWLAYRRKPEEGRT